MIRRNFWLTKIQGQGQGREQGLKRNEQACGSMQACRSQGFSLLEILLVLALVLIFAKYSMAYWQVQQHPVRRQLAWLQLQHILLVQEEYHVVHHKYADSLADLPVSIAANTDYSYQISLIDDQLLLSAQVQPEGMQAADKYCWQLNLNSQGVKTAFDKENNPAVDCD